MFDSLLDRLPAARDYFEPRMEQMLERVNEHAIEFRFKKNGRTYQKNLAILQNHLEKQINHFKKMPYWAAVLKGGPQMFEQAEQAVAGLAIPKAIAPVKEADEVPAEPKKKLAKGESFRESVSMFLKGEAPESIAAKRGMAASTIEGHLAQGVKEGLVPIALLVMPDKMEMIEKALTQTAGSPLADTKALLSDDVSYGDIRGVQAHHQWLAATPK